MFLLRYIIIAVSILWAGSEIILAVTRRSQSRDIHIDKSSMRIIWITIALAVNSGVIVGLQQTGYFGSRSGIFSTAGIICILCGLLIRWTAILSLKHQFTVNVSIIKEHRLIKKGIYRYARHPAYTGSLLSFFGLGLFFANYISLLIIFIPIFFAFLYRIKVEERALIDYFGDEYASYCTSTKRLIPGIF